MCDPCASPLTTLGTGATTCDACEKYYYNAKLSGATGTRSTEAQCRECPEGALCDSVGNELGTLWIEAGFFRSRPDSKKIYLCTLGKAACPGSNQTGNELCQLGYEGPLCDRSDSSEKQKFGHQHEHTTKKTEKNGLLHAATLEDRRHLEYPNNPATPFST